MASKDGVTEQCRMEMFLGDDCEEKKRRRREGPLVYIHLSEGPAIHYNSLLQLLHAIVNNRLVIDPSTQ